MRKDQRDTGPMRTRNLRKAKKQVDGYWNGQIQKHGNTVKMRWTQTRDNEPYTLVSTVLVISPVILLGFVTSCTEHRTVYPSLA